METYEKLCSFYLGKIYNQIRREVEDHKLLYDSKDLTTHAVAVGMTGSGKTGLGITLLEEAAIDGIPAIIIDPKGDMGNLLLTFPDLLPQDFQDWVNVFEDDSDEANKFDEAKKKAELWKNGLAEWDQSGERIKRLKESAEFSIYTPGSSAGKQISILKTFSCPEEKIREDEDLLRELVNTSVTSILNLLDLNSDPVNSREYILLANIFYKSWERGDDLDLVTLIKLINNPTFNKIGVIDIDTFYPPKERNELSLLLNNLLASPTFSSWLKGEELNIDKLLYDASGKPRISIMYISHLSDKERMFFVSLLLNQITGWIRTQPGSTSLRAILYFDEIFGYIPPTANPPSKRPILSLLKQARAFGLGIVLATQNPVDLDYKGLSNIGTWFIGRLQTERDRERIMDGLENSSSALTNELDRKDLEQIIAGLDKRVFLLHNIHEKEIVLFYTRWALSYLAGPLQRTQIKFLTKNFKTEILPDTDSFGSATSTINLLEPGIKQCYFPIRLYKPKDSKIIYKPFLWGIAETYFDLPDSDKKSLLEINKIVELQTPADYVDWTNSGKTKFSESDVDKSGVENAEHLRLINKALRKSNYVKWKNDYKDFIYRSEKIQLLKNPSLNLYSEPNEEERSFRIRTTQFAREKRDEWIADLRKDYEEEMVKIEKKIKNEGQKLKKEEDQADSQKIQTLVSIGSTILGAFLGRKILSKTTIGKAGTAINKIDRSYKESKDVERVKESLGRLKSELQELDKKFREEVDEATVKFDALNEELELINIYPNKKDIEVKLFCLAWLPFFEDGNGEISEAY